MEEKGRGGAEGPCSFQLTWLHTPPPKPSSSRPPKESFPGQLHNHQARLLLLWLPKKGIHSKPACTGGLCGPPPGNQGLHSLPIHLGSQHMGGWSGALLSPMVSRLQLFPSFKVPSAHRWPSHPCPPLFLTAAVCEVGKLLACESMPVSRRRITHRPCKSLAEFRLLLGQLVLWPSLG